MLGFTTALFHPPIPSPIRSSPPTTPVFPFKSTSNSILPSFRLPRKSAIQAEKGNGKGKGKGKGKNEEEEEEEEKMSENGGENEESKNKDKGPVLSVKWRDLLEPDRENILAIGLSGVLTWASVQVLWQLFFISFAILVAAVKYFFIAALLIFILITLL